ncbi:Peptidase A1 [Macrophomina phaseolina MS6]|uniref:Peptidase A1 n=2 Tax=Macrophomina phaseolina TaxID=35725 RepID=K2RPM8_MACPH|nr:Peptidase A1 [Macrophomina phaseolina MS6]KAH7063361.1 aspartic peptidase domain-containing protein [Macrophomina phaseolina]
MHSLRLLLLLVTLLAAVVLARPAPTKTTKTLKPRSFKVPRSLNPKIKRKDGAQAMRKAMRKYGFKPQKAAAGNQTLAAANATNENGEVAALPEDNEALFLSPVKIGGQTLNLDFDSGSSDLWVFSTQLSQQTIGGHTAYDSANSTTFEPMNGATFLITYGDGSGAAGNVGLDTVDIGGATVTKQAIEMATAVSQSFIEDTNTDGLVGLAFSKINTVKPQQQKTFFDNIMPDLEQPVFTADLTNDTTGTYEFGTIDNTKFKGALTYTAVNTAQGFWQFPSKAFMVDGQKIDNPTGNDAIADTGTSLLLVDDNVAKAYYSKVQGAVNDPQAGGFIYPCDAKMPDIAVAVGDYMAVIPGDQVTFAAVDQANTTCFGGVQGNQGSSLQIYGDTMFKAQFGKSSPGVH